MEEFLARIDACRRGESLSDREVIQLVPYLVSGLATHWYRVHGRKFVIFDEFRHALRANFGDPEYEDRVQAEVFTREQGPDKSVVEYLICVQRLWQCQGGTVPLSTRLTNPYDRLRPEFNGQIKRSDFETFEWLTALAWRGELLR